MVSLATQSPRILLPALFLTCIYGLPAQCQFTIVAGPPSTSAGDGGPALSAWLLQPKGVSVDASGNVLVADSGNNRIRQVSTSGLIQTIAGPGSLNDPEAVLAAPDGSVYIADTGNNRILRLVNGALTTFAGTGHAGFSGEGGVATSAEFTGPTGMALDTHGALYIADTGNNRIRMINSAGIVTTVAGTRNPSPPTQFCCSAGDGGLATAAQLLEPRAVAVASDGTLYIADYGNQKLRRVTPGGTISTIVTRTDSSSFTDLALMADGSLLIADNAFHIFLLAKDGVTVTQFLSADASNIAVGLGGVYFSGVENLIQQVPVTGGKPTTIAGQTYWGTPPDPAPALGPIFESPVSMVATADGTLWVADYGNAKIRKILPDGTEHIFANAQVGSIALDPSGIVYGATSSQTVLKFASDGTSRVFAGGGNSTIPLPGAAAVAATSVYLMYPMGIVFDSSGNLFVLSLTRLSTDPNFIITRVTPAGQLTTIVLEPLRGAPLPGYQGFAIDGSGNLLVPTNQPNSNPIFRYGPDGSVPTGPALPTASGFVSSVAVSPSGEIFYITSNSRIRGLNSGSVIYNRDLDQNQSNYSPWFDQYAPTQSLAIDPAGNIYEADSTLEVIRKFPAGACLTAPMPQLKGAAAQQPYEGSADESVNAPGELISLYGSGLGPKTPAFTQIGPDGLVTTELAGTRVLFEGVPAPIYYAADGQINTAIPFTMYGRATVRVQVEYNGVLSAAIPLTMAESAPSIFTTANSLGNPVTLVVNQDGSINSSSHPAPAGSFITIYATGFGQTTPAGVDGHPAALPLPKPVLPVSVAMGGSPAPVVLYAGDAPGLAEGVIQLDIQLPAANLSASLTLTVGDATVTVPLYHQ